jgi:hypothetical protein
MEQHEPSYLAGRSVNSTTILEDCQNSLILYFLATHTPCTKRHAQEGW